MSGTFDERRFQIAVQRMIALTNDGANPDDALEKVACEEDYPPQVISLMAGAYNKSKTVHFMKNASEAERIAGFPVANPNIVIGKIFGEQSAPVEKVACEVPAGDFSKSDIPEGDGIEKIADEVKPEVTALSDRYYKNRAVCDSTVFTLINKYASLQKSVESKLKTDIFEARERLYGYIEKAARSIEHMDSSDLKKVTQLVFNGFSEVGFPLLKTAAVVARQTLPELNKTAHTAVFPSCEPYLSLTSAAESAYEVVKCKKALELFTKEADGGGVLENTLANYAAGKMVIGGLDPTAMEDILKTSPKPSRNIVDEMDPTFFNTLKEMEARKNFMDLALYDEDLSKYNFKDLVKAYNTTVSMIPETVGNPALMRNLMLRNLETGGTKDPFELKTELEISKGLKELELKERELRLKHEENEARKPAKMIRYFTAPDSSGQTKNVLGALSLALDKSKEPVGNISKAMASSKAEVPEKPSVSKEDLDMLKAYLGPRTRMADIVDADRTPVRIVKMLKNFNAGTPTDEDRMLHDDVQHVLQKVNP